jgi:hypothetical protein
MRTAGCLLSLWLTAARGLGWLRPRVLGAYTWLCEAGTPSLSCFTYCLVLESQQQQQQQQRRRTWCSTSRPLHVPCWAVCRGVLRNGLGCTSSSVAHPFMQCSPLADAVGKGGDVRLCRDGGRGEGWCVLCCLGGGSPCPLHQWPPDAPGDKGVGLRGTQHMCLYRRQLLHSRSGDGGVRTACVVSRAAVRRHAIGVLQTLRGTCLCAGKYVR